MMLQLKVKNGADGPEIGKAKCIVNKLENTMRQGLEGGRGQSTQDLRDHDKYDCFTLSR